ncbi:hypothetical protein [Candidatus Nitrosotenuis sp. DW1]|uniref:hypothetical protein n=1 Tax=Candidatus Nitrosotenuis sp. DW1 TaxID=2259672 RepID=UPI0015CA8926|nr:hypothetical protein [Candidatus Nitrosotenuis sp. DW1]QLH09319.1 hypothetical protein DSQ19_07380 [Candidatus Nitrosotenuis sp. DW1]
MKLTYVLVVTALIPLILQVGTMPAFAAQLSWDAVKNPDSPKFTFQRTVSIEYPDGGVIADSLRGRQEGTHLNAKADFKTVEKINDQLAKAGSQVRISDVYFEYSAELVGHEHDATIDYKITMIPTIGKFLIREYSENSAALFDVAWRGIKVEGPVVLSDEAGQIDINSPESFLQRFPSVHEKIVSTGAEKILRMSLIDASGLLLPLAKWHTLMDPTAVIVDASRYGFKGNVITTLSMGESTIFTPTKEKISEIEFASDKKYTVRTLESADNANLFIPGYAAPTILSQYEMIGASPKASSGGTNDNFQGQFPIFVMYGMAVIGALGAIGFFWWSGRKAKKEINSSQTGIDPKHLRGISTSEASGSYHTNRGESHLVDSQTYNQTESVYEKSKGTMPKDWSN